MTKPALVTMCLSRTSTFKKPVPPVVDDHDVAMYQPLVCTLYSSSSGFEQPPCRRSILSPSLHYCSSMIRLCIVGQIYNFLASIGTQCSVCATDICYRPETEEDEGCINHLFVELMTCPISVIRSSSPSPRLSLFSNLCRGDRSSIIFQSPGIRGHCLVVIPKDKPRSLLMGMKFCKPHDSPLTGTSRYFCCVCGEV